MKAKDDIAFTIDNGTPGGLSGAGWVLAVDDKAKRVQVATDLGLVIWMDQKDARVIASPDAPA